MHEAGSVSSVCYAMSKMLCVHVFVRSVILTTVQLILENNS